MLTSRPTCCSRLGLLGSWRQQPAIHHRQHRRAQFLRCRGTSFMQPVDKLQELLQYLQDAQSSVDLQKHLVHEIKALRHQRALALAQLLCSGSSVPSMLHSTARQVMLEELAELLWDTDISTGTGTGSFNPGSFNPGATLALDVEARRDLLGEVRLRLAAAEQVVLYAPCLDHSNLDAHELIAAACTYLAAGYCNCSSQYVSTADSLLRRASLLQAVGGGRKLAGSWQHVDMAMARAVCAILLGRLGEAQALLRGAGKDVGGYKQGSWPGLQAATEMYMIAERWLEQHIVAMFPAELHAQEHSLGMAGGFGEQSEASAQHQHQFRHSGDAARMEKWLQSTPLLETSRMANKPLLPDLLSSLKLMPWALWSLAAVAVASFLAVVPGSHHLPAAAWKLPQVACFTMCSSLQAAATRVEAQAGVRVVVSFESEEHKDNKEQQHNPSTLKPDNVPSDHSYQEPSLPPPPPPARLTKASATNLLRRYQATKAAAWSHGCSGQLVSQTCEGSELLHLLQWIKEDRQGGVHRIITPESIQVDSVQNLEPSRAVVKAMLEEHHSTIDVAQPRDARSTAKQGPGLQGGDRNTTSTSTNKLAEQTSHGQTNELANLHGGGVSASGQQHVASTWKGGQRVESMRSFRMSNVVQCEMVHTESGWKISSVVSSSSSIKML